MKHYQLFRVTAFAFLLAFTTAAFSQVPTPMKRSWERAKQKGQIPSDGTVRNPDGSVRYPDGRVSYPDGRVIYPGNTSSRSDNGVYYPDGSVHYPNGKVVYQDGTVRYPNGTIRYPDGRVVRADGTVVSNDESRRNLPPGHAKKLYGKKSARDYAPGHLKKDKDYGYDDNDWGNDKKHKKHKTKK